MVRQERDRREPKRGGNQAESRRLAARKILESQDRYDKKAHEAQVQPGFRETVERLMRDQWNEPVIVLRLGDISDVGFDVPGRRKDGTVAGKRLVRRFFWNIGRGVAVVAVNIISPLFDGLGAGNPLKRQILVTGPANAMALDLLDSIRRAQGPWLVCSPSSLAVVDTGSTYIEPHDAPPPRILWQAREPHRPRIDFRKRTITWPDDSVFAFPLHSRPESQHLRTYFEPPDTIHWHGRPL